MKPQAILFDLDDTLIETNQLFTDARKEMKTIIANEEELDYELVSQTFEESLVRAYNEVSVNPINEWPLAMKYLNEKIPISEAVRHKCIERAFEIYTKVPEIIDGTYEILEYFNNLGVKVGLVTHAIEDWTHLKLDTHNLKQYFHHIEICDANRHKNSEDWKRTFLKLDVHPEYGMIIGDNVKGDIIAGHSIGVKNLIWINRKEAWSVYTVGDIPKETVTVKHLNEILPTLKQKYNN